MARTAAHLVDHVIPHVPARQWVLSLPIPLRLLLAAQAKLVTPALQVVHRAITRFLLDQAGLKAEHADSGAVTLIQRFGSAANLNIHLLCLVLDGVYRCDTEGEPLFVAVPAPTDEALQTVLHKIITRLMKLLARKGVLVEEQGQTYMADDDADSDETRVLRPLQAARFPGARGPAAPELLEAEVWRLIARGNPKATASRDALRRCDRPSTCGSWTQEHGQWVIERLARGHL